MKHQALLPILLPPSYRSIRLQDASSNPAPFLRQGNLLEENDTYDPSHHAEDGHSLLPDGDRLGAVKLCHIVDEAGPVGFTGKEDNPLPILGGCCLDRFDLLCGLL